MFLQYERQIEVHVAGLLIHDLRMSFQYSNIAEPKDQDSTITLYNLKESTYEQISNVQMYPPYNIANVKAGYKYDLGLQNVFAGTIAWLERDAKDGTIRTILHIGDRIRDYSPNWVELSYKNVPVRKAVVDLANQMGMTVGNMHVIPERLQKENVYFSERGENALRSLLTSLRDEVPDLYWYQDKNKVMLAKGSEPRFDVGMLVKSPSNGLIGVPKLEEDKRLKVSMLMDTRVRLRGRIRFLESKYIDDSIEYTIDRVQHKGDNWTGNFVTELECIPPGYQPLSSSGRIPQTEFAKQGGSRWGNNSLRNLSK